RDVHLGPPAPTAPPCGPLVDANSTGAPARVFWWPRLGPDAAAYTTLLLHSRSMAAYIRARRNPAAAKLPSALGVDCTSTQAAQLGDPELPGRARTFFATACRRDVHLGPPAPTAPPCGPLVDANSTGAPARVFWWPRLGPDAAAYTTLLLHSRSMAAYIRARRNPAAAKLPSALGVDCTSTQAAQLGDPELPGRARTFFATACRRDVHLGPPAPTAPPCGPCVDANSTGAPARVSRWPHLGPDEAAYTTLPHHSNFIGA